MSVEVYTLKISVVCRTKGDAAESFADGSVAGDAANGLVCGDVDSALELVKPDEGYLRRLIEQLHEVGLRVQNVSSTWFLDSDVTSMLREHDGKKQ